VNSCKRVGVANERERRERNKREKIVVSFSTKQKEGLKKKIPENRKKNRGKRKWLETVQSQLVSEVSITIKVKSQVRERTPKGESNHSSQVDAA